MAAPVDRRRLCGELIAGGATVYDAMVKAGFGPRFAAGNADSFAAFLTRGGYLPKPAAAKARPGVAKAEPIQDDKE